MTAVEIIEEIKAVAEGEQSKVLEFARQAAEMQPLIPEELGKLAKQMVEAQEPAEADDCKRRSYADSTAANRMPKVRRRKLPQALLTHLLARMRQRSISPEQIVLLARWLDTEPDVPQEKWFKAVPGSWFAAKTS